ncbi:cyanate transporter [Sphingopyxis sp. DBS4]|uniref:cyanate transporter n=1 Tax=Sphingopyxis sp. DBS4 TaxID=2968500 RepID=UPI00214B33D3|nr:cyanate transporter [Sphingopyxis sp. DBS4]
MKSARLLPLAAIALIGLNLRPFLTGIGPLTGAIGAATGLGLQDMALLTLLPMLLMGIGAFAGPLLQRRIAPRRLVVLALALLALGSFLRLFAASGALLLGTALLCGLGVAVVQAVLPGVIKRDFPQRVAIVMGLYSAMLMGGGALGAQAAPLLAEATGSWRAGLALFAAPAVAALALATRLPRDEVARTGHGSMGVLLRRPRTWLLMACFGLVNGGYASSVAWLAPYYQDQGRGVAASGTLLAVLAIAQAAAALLLPIAARGRTDRRGWLALTLAMQAAGFAGLAFAPQAAPLVIAILLGAGLGGCFALMMIVALDHLADAADAGALSALMQGGGFLLAALPPWIVAALHDRTGGFVAGWLLHLGCIAVVAVLIARLAPGGYARAMAAAPRPRPATL